MLAAAYQQKKKKITSGATDTWPTSLPLCCPRWGRQLLVGRLIPSWGLYLWPKSTRRPMRGGGLSPWGQGDFKLGGR